MAHLRLPLGPGEFAQGVIRYSDNYPGERYSRIVVPATFGDIGNPIPVIVDTGGPWPILDPESIIGYGYPIEREESLSIRGIRYNGWLFRMEIRLEAEEEEPAEIDGTVFVPRLDPDERWKHPNFLGLDGFLERIRFAVDPEHNLFYFGTL